MNKKKLKSVFHDILNPLGYISIKDMFFKKINEIFLIVKLKKEWFGGIFNIEIGIFVDEEGDIAHPPEYEHTHMLQHVYGIVPRSVRNTLLTVLNLEVPMKDNERTTIISDVLRQYVVPYLDSFSTLEGIAYHLDPNNGFVPLVTLTLREILGRKLGRDFSIPTVETQASPGMNDLPTQIRVVSLDDVLAGTDPDFADSDPDDDVGSGTT